MNEKKITELVYTTKALVQCDEKMYKALAEIMKPEIDEAYSNGLILE